MLLDGSIAAFMLLISAVRMGDVAYCPMMVCWTSCIYANVRAIVPADGICAIVLVTVRLDGLPPVPIFSRDIF